MISDVNILTFPYFLFFIFFLFVHLSIIFRSKKKFISTSLQFCHAAYFITKFIRYILSYFYSTHIRCVSNWIQLADSAPNKHIFVMFVSIAKGINKWCRAYHQRFPFQFFLFNFLFFLVSCFYILSPPK